jgi:dimethylaniline monooxygenase (N-oxide forming) / hypotaurine monooxygenase
MGSPVSSSVGTEERTRRVARVAVIGAGAAGLSAAKALREVGLRPVVFEASADLGGLWLYDSRDPGTRAAYRSLRTNTSKQITAFSDAPFPHWLPDYPSRAAVENYLRDYAVRFKLLPLIRFRHSVSCVTPEEEHSWRLTIQHEDRRLQETYDAVMVCTGIFRRPIIPIIPGMDRFMGTVMHSLEYGDPERFAGKDVVVIGLGSSAADIATDLVGTAAHVTLSTRRGAWVVPRYIGGRPRDHAGTRLSQMLPASLRERERREGLARECAARGLPTPEAVWRAAHIPFDPDSAPGVPSDSLLPGIVSGAIGIRPGIERMEGRLAQFADGSQLSPDVVIFATGYDLDFPLLPPELRPWTDTGAGLYRLVFPPNHPTLPFIGVCRAHGPIFPIVEMQSRWAAQVLTGWTTLPSPDLMRVETEERTYRQTEQHDSVIRVPLLPYLDELGALIGVRPHIWRHPLLLPYLLAGPPVAAQYRLEGPNRWRGAGKAIRSARSGE